MTFEMIMAAMALAAKADRYSGNHPDYDLEDRLREQDEREEQEYLWSLKQKYPKDRAFNQFILRCRLYIPAYKETVDCMIRTEGIEVFRYGNQDGEGCVLLITAYWGYEVLEMGEVWLSPADYNNRTCQMNATVKEALAHAISYGIYEAKGMTAEMRECEQRVNELLRSRKITFRGSDFSFRKLGNKSFIDLYEFASEGIDLDAPFVEEDSDNEFDGAKITVPFESIGYEGRKYIIVPYSYEGYCLCITGNVIMGISAETETYMLDASQRNIVFKVQLREPFTGRILNRKDRFDGIRKEDRLFYYNVIQEAMKLNKFFSSNESRNHMREEVIEIIEQGILGKKIDEGILNCKMKKLSGREYVYETQGLTCDGKETSLYQFCEDTYNIKEGSGMGLFDGFFNGASDMRVFKYIRNMPKATLVNAIRLEYEHIKGSCRYAPAMGEYGSFEFAGALLIWKYCKENVRTNMNVCGELMIILGETIGCAYNGMPAGEWSDKIDEVIYNNDLLDYDEWNEIYNYLKENYEYEIHALEFNMGNMSQQKRDGVYASFVRTYNSMSDYNSTFEYYTRQGLQLKADMPFNICS